MGNMWVDRLVGSSDLLVPLACVLLRLGGVDPTLLAGGKFRNVRHMASAGTRTVYAGAKRSGWNSRSRNCVLAACAARPGRHGGGRSASGAWPRRRPAPAKQSRRTARRWRRSPGRTLPRRCRAGTDRSNKAVANSVVARARVRILTPRSARSASCSAAAAASPSAVSDKSNVRRSRSVTSSRSSSWRANRRPPLRIVGRPDPERRFEPSVALGQIGNGLGPVAEVVGRAVVGQRIRCGPSRTAAGWPTRGPRTSRTPAIGRRRFAAIRA